MLNVVKNNVLLKLLLTAVLMVADIVTAANATLSTSPMDSFPLVKMLLGLIAIIVLIFILAWLSRKMKLHQTSNDGHKITNLATLPLTTREKISLIEVGGKQILIGIAPGRINMLHVFEQMIEVGATTQTDAANSSFSNHFKKALGMAVSEGKQS